MLPLGKRLRLSDVRSTKNSKVKRLSAIARLGERKEERGGGGGEGERSEESEAEVDLREIINRKNKNTERYDVYNVWVYVSEMIVATYPSLSPLLPPSCPLSLSLSLSLCPSPSPLQFHKVCSNTSRSR